MTDVGPDLDLIRAAAVEAGALALAERAKGVSVRSKPGGSPVTSADYAVDGGYSAMGPEQAKPAIPRLAE